MSATEKGTHWDPQVNPPSTSNSLGVSGSPPPPSLTTVGRSRSGFSFGHNEPTVFSDSGSDMAPRSPSPLAYSKSRPPMGQKENPFGRETSTGDGGSSSPVTNVNSSANPNENDVTVETITTTALPSMTEAAIVVSTCSEHDPQSPGSVMAHVTSPTAEADRRRKRRPPSLFSEPPAFPARNGGEAEVTGTNASPISDYSSHYGDQKMSQSHLPLTPGLFSDASSRRRQPRCPPFSVNPLHLPPTQKSEASASSSTVARKKANKRSPLIRLSHNKQTLVAGIFRVSREGCSTVRNVLLLNPKRIDQNDAPPANSLFSPWSQRPVSSPFFSATASPRQVPGSIPPTPTLPQEGEAWGGETGASTSFAPVHPGSSFTLQSTIMHTPYSPITYSMDNQFPSTASPYARDGTSRDTGVTLLRAARDNAAPRRLCTLGSGGVEYRPSHPPTLPRSESGSTIFSPLAGEFAHTGSLIPYMDLAHLVNDGSTTPRLPPNAVSYEDLLIKGGVGEGASATVFVAIHKPTGRRLAVKRVDLSALCLQSDSSRLYSTTNGRVKQLQHIVVRELQVLHLTYRSPFMVKVYNAFYIEESQSLDIVMEFMHYGSVDHLAECLQTHARATNDKVQEERRMLGEEGMPGSAHNSPEAVDHLYLPGSLSQRYTTPNESELQFLRTPLSALTEYFPAAEGNQGNNHSWSMNADSMVGGFTPIELVSVKSNVGTEDSYEEGCVVEETYGVAERIVAVVGEQLLRGVRDMHGRGYIHRDIKPGNVLVNEHGVVKLSDFGLSQKCDALGQGIVNPHMKLTPVAITHCNTPAASPQQLSLPRQEAPGLPPMSPVFLESERSGTDKDGLDVLTGSHTSSSLDSGSRKASSDDDDDSEDNLCSGTDKYMSPERQRGERHGKPSDIWAVGVTLAEFAVGQYPYNLENTADVFERVHRLEQPIPFERFNQHRTVRLTKEFQDFVALATLPNPADRPTAKELLEHPFFRQWKSPFNLKEYLAERVPIPSNAFKEEFLRERRRAAGARNSLGVGVVATPTRRSSSGSSNAPLRNSATLSTINPQGEEYPQDLRSPPENKFSYQVRSLSSMLGRGNHQGNSLASKTNPRKWANGEVGGVESSVQSPYGARWSQGGGAVYTCFPPTTPSDKNSPEAVSAHDHYSDHYRSSENNSPSSNPSAVERAGGAGSAGLGRTNQDGLRGGKEEGSGEPTTNFLTSLAPSVPVLFDGSVHNT